MSSSPSLFTPLVVTAFNSPRSRPQIFYHENICKNLIRFMISNGLIVRKAKMGIEKQVDYELYKMIQITLKKEKNKGGKVNLDDIISKKMDRKKKLEEEEEEREIETDEDLEWSQQ